MVGRRPSRGPAGDVAAGKRSSPQGCGACHTFTPAGSTGKVGPDLDNLAADAKKANQGTLEEFIKASIVDPAPTSSPATSGRDAADYGQKLKPQQVADLVAFLTQGP